MARNGKGTSKVAEDVTQEEVDKLAAEFKALEEKLDKLAVRIAAKCHREYKEDNRPSLVDLQRSMRSLSDKVRKDDEFLNSVYDLYN